MKSISRNVVFPGLRAFGFAVIVTIVCISGVSPAASIDTPTDNRADYPNSEIPQYEKFEITFSMAADPYSNPFNPDVIDIEAHFVNPDTQQEMVVPAFWYQQYNRGGSSSNEYLSAVGTPTWKVRFAPTTTGTWQYYITATDSTSTDRYPDSGYQTFAAVDSDNHGFLRVGDNKDYLKLDDGTDFLGIGPDVCWPTGAAGDETYSYDYYFDQFEQHGCNFSRIWIFNALQPRDKWVFNIQDVQLGGDYDLADAWRVDYVLEIAKQHGVYIMWCTEGCPGEFESSHWDENIYNVDLGGPCEQTFDFVLNETAKMYYRRVLRYLVARYSYNTNLGVWEFWNEFHEMEWHCNNYDEQKFIDWHEELGQYLESIDPYGRIITTSMGSFDSYPGLWSLPEMDVAQMHAYGGVSWCPDDQIGNDMARLIDYFSTGTTHGAGAFNKPQFFSEYGIGSGYASQDTQGVYIHNGLWTGLMCKLGVLPMTWWWENFPSKPQWWDHYLAVSNFADSVEWGKTDFQRQSLLDCSSDSRLETYGMVSDTQRLYWIRNNENNWHNVVVNGQSPSTVPQGTEVNISDAPAGIYDIEWWDTYQGQVISVETITTQSEGLTLSLPVDVIKDIAVKIDCSPKSDLNFDGKVTFLDYAELASWWLDETSPAPDFDQSGIVDYNDLKTFASQWLTGVTNPGPTDEIVLDSAASTVSGTDNATLSWSHEIGSGQNSILIVGVAAEDSSENDLNISSVTCSGVEMTPLAGSAESIFSNTVYMKTQLFYILNPQSEAADIQVNYSGNIHYKAGGSISLFNVAQEEPQAVAANSNLTTNSISTDIMNSSASGALVDVVGCGNPGSFTADSTGMDEQWEQTIGNTITAAGAVRFLDAPGTYTNTWRHNDANRLTHSVVALSCASPE